MTLKSLGLEIQLNHSTTCISPTACHKSFRILDTTGIHNVAVKFCGCNQQVSHYWQLLCRGWYPSTKKHIQTCATFQLLELMQMLLVVSKGSTYDYYRVLEKLTNNTGIDVPKPCMQALSRMVLQWRHLKMEKRGGQGHTDSGIAGTSSGELAVLCPSCPWPKINLPKGWETASEGEK